MRTISYFARIFTTELTNSGLPIFVGPKLCMLNEPIIKLEALDDLPVRGFLIDDVIINRNIAENKNFNIALFEMCLNFIFFKERL